MMNARDKSLILAIITLLVLLPVIPLFQGNMASDDDTTSQNILITDWPDTTTTTFHKLKSVYSVYITVPPFSPEAARQAMHFTAHRITLKVVDKFPLWSKGTFT